MGSKTVMMSAKPDAALEPPLDEPDFAGFFVWRVYSDPDDVSQEAEWGFSPEGKQAEVVVRDAFAARCAAVSPPCAAASVLSATARLASADWSVFCALVGSRPGRKKLGVRSSDC